MADGADVTGVAPADTPATLGPQWGGRLFAAFAVAFFACTLLPRVNSNPTLLWSVVAAGGLVLAWGVALLVQAKRAGKALTVSIRLRKAHYIQTIVQVILYIYWAWYWDKVLPMVGLIAAQLFFAYMFEMCMTWKRYGNFRLGFGAVPIVGSFNLFLWFPDDLFFLQFAMISLAWVSREFLRWKGGLHMFNPSAFGLTAAGVVLIAGGWTHLTFGVDIAQNLGNGPHCYEAIFLGGLIVQVFFPRIVLITCAAMLTSVCLGWAYTSMTGVHYYLDTAAPIAVYLGMTLLITDPVTSPRSNGGAVIFGVLYGIAVFVLFGALDMLSQPPIGDDPGVSVTFFDKLLFVPALNLMVHPVDRIGRKLSLAKLGWKWGTVPTNLTHVAIWVVVFFAVLSQLKDHPGHRHLVSMLHTGLSETPCTSQRYPCHRECPSAAERHECLQECTDGRPEKDREDMRKMFRCLKSQSTLDPWARCIERVYGCEVMPLGAGGGRGL